MAGSRAGIKMLSRTAWRTKAIQLRAEHPDWTCAQIAAECGVTMSAVAKVAPRARKTQDERFWAKVAKSDGGCWEWTATLRAGLHGTFYADGRHVYAHRYAYERLVGPVPEGLELDHLCRNPSCVNPAHLEPVTHVENVLRGMSPMAINARKTHCANGHAFDEANTYYTRAGTRACRTCHRDGEALRKARLRPAA